MRSGLLAASVFVIGSARCLRLLAVEGLAHLGLEIVVRGSGDDPWAMVSGAALVSIAAKCADDLAAYLSNTPEAAPAGAALSYAQ